MSNRKADATGGQSLKSLERREHRRSRADSGRWSAGRVWRGRV